MKVNICLIVLLVLSLLLNLYTFERNQNESQQSNISSNTHDRITVYIYPHGKKYHYDPACAGHNSMKIELDEVIKFYEPCKNCS